MQEKEIWKDAKGYEGFYQVSSFGRVRSVDRCIHASCGSYFLKGKILSQQENERGYLRVGLSMNGIRNLVRVHRLVAEAFIGDTAGNVVNHKDGNVKNNNVCNLEIISQTENMRHAYRTGLCDMSTKKVVDSDGIYYESISEAARFNGINRSTVSSSAKLGRKTKCGKQFFFIEGQMKNFTNRSRPVIREDGVEYLSIKAASRLTGICRSSIYSAIEKGGRAGGYLWRQKYSENVV